MYKFGNINRVFPPQGAAALIWGGKQNEHYPTLLRQQRQVSHKIKRRITLMRRFTLNLFLGINLL